MKRSDQETLALLPATKDGQAVIPEVDVVFFPGDCWKADADETYRMLCRRILRRISGQDRFGRHKRAKGWKKYGPWEAIPIHISNYTRASVSDCYFTYEQAHQAYQKSRQE
ncbi:MAG: hypothetical protein VW739_05520 [Pelagibacteraceae bacterium]